MSVLTRDEAQTRARLLDVHRYEIDLDLTRGDELFDSRTVIHFTVRERPDRGHLRRAQARRTALRHPRRPAARPGRPRRRQPAAAHGLTAGRARTARRRRHALLPHRRGHAPLHRPHRRRDLRLHPAVPGRRPARLRRLRPARPQGRLRADRHRPRRLDRPRQRHHRTRSGDGRWQAAPTPPISTYLVAVAAGPWHSVRTEHARTALRHPLPPLPRPPPGRRRRRNPRHHPRAASTATTRSSRSPTPSTPTTRRSSPSSTPAPWRTPAWSPSATSSSTAPPSPTPSARPAPWSSPTRWPTCGSATSSPSRWWDDIWLNESFAEYMGYQTLTEATRFTDTWTDFGIARKAWGYDADQRPSTHPVAPDPDAVPDTASALLNFDGISYAKGASALRQLVAWLGEKDFLAGINTHFARHKFGNATLADFIDSLADATERDVHAWADSWLRTTGVDTLTPTIDRGRRRHLHADRRRTHGSRPHRIAVGLYDQRPRRRRRPPRPARTPRSRRPPGRTDPPRSANAPPCSSSTTATSPTPRSASTPTPSTTVRDAPLRPPRPADPRRRLERPARLRPRRRTRPHRLPGGRPHPPPARDATSPSSRASSPSPPPRSPTATCPPDDRPAALATLTALCRDLIRRTEDGSHPGLRLTAVRHFIDAAAQPDTIAAWLADGTVPGGPELDPELRWRILGRLAVLGATDDADDRRRTRPRPERHRPGRRRPLPRRPARPGGQTRRPGRRMFTTDDLSNYLFTATAQGFWQPEQADSGTGVRAALLRRPPSPWPPAAAPPSPKQRAAGPSPPTPSTPRPSAWARSACATANPIPALRPQAGRPTGRPGAGVAGEGGADGTA